MQDCIPYSTMRPRSSRGPNLTMEPTTSGLRLSFVVRPHWDLVLVQYQNKRVPTAEKIHPVPFTVNLVMDDKLLFLNRVQFVEHIQIIEMARSPLRAVRDNALETVTVTSKRPLQIGIWSLTIGAASFDLQILEPSKEVYPSIFHTQFEKIPKYGS